MWEEWPLRPVFGSGFCLDFISPPLMHERALVSSSSPLSLSFQSCQSILLALP